MFMQIQVNADHTVTTPAGFSEYVRKTIEETLHHCKSQITRVEVHFSDENGGKAGGNDKRCMMEARLAGRKPIAITDQAETLDEVISGAAEKLKHAVAKILEKEHDHHPKFSDTDTFGQTNGKSETLLF
jgi:ribosome-associated translation inhibitor RaiA